MNLLKPILMVVTILSSMPVHSTVKVGQFQYSSIPGVNWTVKIETTVKDHTIKHLLREQCKAIAEKHLKADRIPRGYRVGILGCTRILGEDNFQDWGYPVRGFDSLLNKDVESRYWLDLSLNLGVLFEPLE